ncbi:factor associated with metabolism and energy [Pituophis catenifer annectens]|uniref:factor associated with metabolism and energy n=1 Tax=Pituophis catenifer annectens TaxID=94852 RepID=UPI0039959464
MGLNSSKTHRKVTKVTPMPCEEREPKQPNSVTVYSFQTLPSSFVSSSGRTPVLERQLPPLRETCYGRYPTVPRPNLLDPTQGGGGGEGGGSIIKQHPPRRLQKLEPFILADSIPAAKYPNLQGGTVTLKEKELGRGEHVAGHPAGRRQYLLQMKMLEIRKEAELKRRLQQEARLNKPKMRDLHLLGTLEHMRGTQSSDDEDRHSTEHEQTFNGSHGDLWHREFLKESGSPKSHLDQRHKVETWLLKQQATTESSSDASSTDTNNWSDCNDNFKKPYRRPALVRTKTERITLFDDFFDKEII